MRVKTKMPELLPRPIGNILRKLTHLGGGGGGGPNTRRHAQFLLPRLRTLSTRRQQIVFRCPGLSQLTPWLPNRITPTMAPRGRSHSSHFATPIRPRQGTATLLAGTAQNRRVRTTAWNAYAVGLSQFFRVSHFQNATVNILPHRTQDQSGMNRYLCQEQNVRSRLTNCINETLR